MEDNDIDHSRRRFLVTTTSVIGAGGLAVAAIPFIGSLNPGAAVAAAAAPVEVDVTKIEPGALISVLWRGRPVWILHRTPDQIEGLHDSALRDRLRDPDSREPQQFSDAVRNSHRSLKPEYLVVVAICTHLGCVPSFRPDQAPPDLGPDWPGGFYCPCHGSRYDLAGRVYKFMPAPLNLPVPPYSFLAPNRLRIGAAADGSQQNWTPKVW